MDDSARQLPQTVKSIGVALADAVLKTTCCPAAVVVRDPATQTASVVAASVGTDRRLLGMTATPESAAGRACVSELTIHARGAQDLLGGLRGDRRQREEHGVALSLLDGRRSVGALVVFAPPELIDRTVHEELAELAGRAGALIGKNVAVRFSKQLGLIDAVTGQPNSPGLERVMRASISRRCSLVSLAVDEFQALDTDAARNVLRQIAAVLRNSLRDYDVPAHIRRGEFALFLPDVALDGAVTVADRVRRAVKASTQGLDGKHPLTCSFGVAAFPDTVSDTEALLTAAVGAREAARESGPDQIASLHQN